jgi:hypothetical protein
VTIFFKITYLLVVLFFFLSCSETIYYSGKIKDLDTSYDYLKDKEEVLKDLGEPNFIDFIDQKYFYFSEKKITKNFFDKKIIARNIVVFNFNESNKIISINNYNLDDRIDLKYLKKSTKNNIMKRGYFERIFGGIGKNSLTDTPQ